MGPDPHGGPVQQDGDGYLVPKQQREFCRKEPPSPGGKEFCRKVLLPQEGRRPLALASSFPPGVREQAAKGSVSLRADGKYKRKL